MVFVRFGNFTSIPSVLEQLLQYGESSTTALQKCTDDGHPVLLDGGNITSLIDILTGPGESLQAYLDQFEQHLCSRCSQCGLEQTRMARFVRHPPLLAFEWPLGKTPSLPNILYILMQMAQDKHSC